MISEDAKELKPWEFQIIEDYSCANTLFKYEELYKFDKIGEEPYELETNFQFKCEVLHFIDDRIRIRYFSDFTNPVVGKFHNSSSDWNKTGEVSEN